MFNEVDVDVSIFVEGDVDIGGNVNGGRVVNDKVEGEESFDVDFKDVEEVDVEFGSGKKFNGFVDVGRGGQVKLDESFDVSEVQVESGFLKEFGRDIDVNFIGNGSLDEVEVEVNIGRDVIFEENIVFLVVSKVVDGFDDFVGVFDEVRDDGEVVESC